MQTVTIERDFDSWRDAARQLLAQATPPDRVWWQEKGAEQGLLIGCPGPEGASSPEPATAVPRAFMEFAKRAACFRDAGRWALLYRILWRLSHGERHLLDVAVDNDVMLLERMDKQVRTDAHKMTAFVRFRRVEDGSAARAEHYVAWHRPQHYVVRLTAPFFVRRFGNMKWSILTPDDCAHWDGRALTFTPGVERNAAPSADQLEELWRTYYANIFNPARIKVAAMKRHMPVRYWETLPEAALVPELLRQAPQRVEAMMAAKKDEYPTAEAYLPERITLPALREAAEECRGCPLYKTGTQTVFGEGNRDARVMMIGEQPGDQEDKAGKPFIGPAGKILDDALAEVGIDRAEVYVTNSVKHFKWEPRGTRRIHAKPNAREIQACKPWLTAELQVIKPQMVVCLGATAAQALMGKDFRITRSRGEIFRDTQYAPWLMATAHPSSILRMPSSEDREEAYRAFVADLRIAAHELGTAKSA
jgi:DNA polymerase